MCKGGCPLFHGQTSVSHVQKDDSMFWNSNQLLHMDLLSMALEYMTCFLVHSTVPGAIQRDQKAQKPGASRNEAHIS